MKGSAMCNIPRPDLAKIFANNWQQFTNIPDFYQLPVFAFEQIFQHEEDLKVESEKALFEFIKQLVHHNSHEYSSLFQYCLVQDLDQEDINELLNMVSYDYVPHEVIATLIDLIDESSD